MNAPHNNKPIALTKKWIEEIVIKLGFCPFAARVFYNNQIVYEICSTDQWHDIIGVLKEVLTKLSAEDNNNSTAFIIFENVFRSFDDYLDLFYNLEQWVEDENYEDFIQLASFHPQYIFDGSDEDDLTNYTNRSPYPLIHILKTKEVSQAINDYPDALAIPENNIKKIEKPETIAVLEKWRSILY